MMSYRAIGVGRPKKAEKEKERDGGGVSCLILGLGHPDKAERREQGETRGGGIGKGVCVGGGCTR